MIEDYETYNESDEEVIGWDKQKCFEDFSWAFRECDNIGADLVTSVLLRNPDIHDRCAKPELFDRFGRIKSSLMDMCSPH